MLTFSKLILVDLLLFDYFKVSCHHNQGLLSLGKQMKKNFIHVTNQSFQVSRALEPTESEQGVPGRTGRQMHTHKVL